MANWADRLAKLAQALATAGTVPDTSISTAETDVDLRLAPDGAGGVEWGTGGSGSGAELAYVEFTATVSPTATSAATANAVVSAGSIAYDGSPVMIEFFCPAAQAPTGGAGRQLLIELYADTADIGIIGVTRTDGTAAADGSVIHASRRLTPSAGNHTYEIKAWVSAGTGSVGAGAGGAGTALPGYIRVTTV